MTPWEIKAKEFSNCNCSYGCPCQFNALPTHGFCEAAVALEIEKGHYGAVKLDGLRMGGIFQWPGPVHEGHGKCQPFVDERADGQQREALLKIMSGQDTEPMATMFVWVPIPDAYKKMGSLEFSKLLLREAKVAVSPGLGFGEYGDDHVRFALVENEHRTRQAIRGIKKTLKLSGTPD